MKMVKEDKIELNVLKKEDVQTLYLFLADCIYKEVDEEQNAKVCLLIF